jgi:DNA-directed RNA polymerase subunit RPC12/RpoP
LLSAVAWREVGKMGLFKKLFGGGSAAEEPQFEIVENNISTDLVRYQVRVRKHGQEMYAEELFQAATKPKDLQFGRFYLLNENPPKLHFAPTLEQAINWFKGRNLPKDGYYNIFWGEEVTFVCSVCGKEAKQPLNITKVEKCTVSTHVPMYMEIVGWRVIEVACELMGPGSPGKILDMFKTKPIVKWDNPNTKYMCEGCAHRLMTMGRQDEVEEFIVFS